MFRSCNPGTRRLEASSNLGSGHNGAVGGRYLSRSHPQVPMSNDLIADRTDRVVKSDAEWRAQLTPDATFVAGKPASNGAVPTRPAAAN